MLSMFTMNARTLGTKKNTRLSQSRPWRDRVRSKPVLRRLLSARGKTGRRDRYHRVQRHQIALGQPCYCAPRRSPVRLMRAREGVPPLQARCSLTTERRAAHRSDAEYWSPVSAPAAAAEPPLSPPPQLSRRTERRRAHRRSTRSRQSPLPAAPRPLDLASGMRQSSRRRHARGCRRERAPLLRHARERSASACMASVRWRARRCARMGDAYTRVVCVCGCFGCC